jgi:four helix bundle protein
MANGDPKMLEIVLEQSPPMPASGVSIEEPSAGYRTIQDDRDGRVWPLAMELVFAVYETTSAFPPVEQFGLTGQVRRAVTSVPWNIAEGNVRNRTADYLRFLRMSRGSLAEVDTQLLIGQRLGYIDDSSALRLSQQTDDLTRQLTPMSAIERSTNRSIDRP